MGKGCRVSQSEIHWNFEVPKRVGGTDEQGERNHISLKLFDKMCRFTPDRFVVVSKAQLVAAALR